MFRLFDLWHQAQSLGPIVRDYAVALGLIAGALGVAYVAPSARIKLFAVLFACAVITTTIAYSVGLKRGADRVKADWDWTLAVEHREGEQVRSDAEHAVRVESPDSGVLANDPWNRDAKPAAVR
jgi:hypothetical protein